MAAFVILAAPVFELLWANLWTTSQNILNLIHLLNPSKQSFGSIAEQALWPVVIHATLASSFF